jgi:hypothetical protein
MRGSIIMFYGSKHGGVKIYFVIYLEKIKKQSHIEITIHVVSQAHITPFLILVINFVY